MSNVEPLLTKEISPYTVVSHLQEKLADTAGIFAVIKTKDGDFHELISGDAGDCAFAALILQQKAVETL